MNRCRPLLCALVLVACLSLPFGAQATDMLDLKVGLKVLPLLNEKIKSPAVVGIVYDPAKPESKAEAESIKSLIDGGVTAPGGIKLISMLIGVGEMKKLSDAKMAFLSGSLSAADLDVAGKEAAMANVLTFSTHLSYVKENKCVLGIVSKPSVQIFYSPVAADAGKISFAQAFIMLASRL